MIQSNATGTYCVSVCDSSHVNFNNTQCLTSCPTGYINSSNSCQTNNNNNNNTNNNTNNSTLTTLSSSKLIPFPILLTLGVVAAICMSSKIALPETIMPCALCAMAGVL